MKIEKVKIPKGEADEYVKQIKDQFEAWAKEKANLEDQIKAIVKKQADLDAKLGPIHSVEVEPVPVPKP